MAAVSFESAALIAEQTAGGYQNLKTKFGIEHTYDSNAV
jgi:hypothetical protein